LHAQVEGEMRPIIYSIQVGLPTQHERSSMGFLKRLSRYIRRLDSQDEAYGTWMTGLYKQPLQEAVWLGKCGLRADVQAGLEPHGGLEKAVLAYSRGHYSFWNKTLAINLLPGGFGENFTIDGLEEHSVCIGDIYRVGEARVQVSQPCSPCWKLSQQWQVHDLVGRIQNTGRTGWHFRILVEGYVRSGSFMGLVDRPNPKWTIAAANEIMYHRVQDRDAARELSSCQLLSHSWRTTLLQRAQEGVDTG
jgi:MOSC domain-containing protein YiiM